MLQTLKSHGIQRVLIAYDRDEAGERGAAKLAAVLMGEGIHRLHHQQSTPQAQPQPELQAKQAASPGITCASSSQNASKPEPIQPEAVTSSLAAEPLALCPETLAV